MTVAMLAAGKRALPPPTPEGKKPKLQPLITRFFSNPALPRPPVVIPCEINIKVTDTASATLTADKKETPKNYSVLSLFCGAGGLDLGFKNAGFEITKAVDIDEDCCTTYKRNIGKHVKRADLSTLALDQLPSSVDVIIGGPPCQGFSVLGLMNESDSRSSLVFTYAAIVGHVKPKMFVMENVAALAEIGKWKEVRDELAQLFKRHSYNVNLIVLNAKDYGVPQSRLRVFFIGTRRPLFPPESIPVPSGTSAPTAGEVLRKLPTPGTAPNLGVCNAAVIPAKNPILRASPYSGSLLFNGKGRPVKLDDVVKALPASMGGNATPIVDEDELRHNAEPWVVDYHKGLMKGKKAVREAPARLRRLTVTEVALLQSFPIDFVFEGTQSSQYRQIGNAVPPKLAEAVALAVRVCLERQGS